MLKTRLFVSSWLFSFFCYIFVTVSDHAVNIEPYIDKLAELFLPYGYADQPAAPLIYTTVIASTIDSIESKQESYSAPAYGVRAYDIHEHGLIGRLWLPHTHRAVLTEAHRRFPAVLFLGDANGGLDDDSATALAERGFIVFDLLYFGDDAGQVLHSPLPPHLIQIPIEYFGRAFNWLKQQPKVDASRLGIVGLGRGSEAAVLTAVHYEGVNAVVLQSPSAVSWVGAGHDGQSAWTISGEAVPYLALSFWEELSHWWRVQWRGEAIVTTDLYAQALDRLEPWDAAWLPVEQLQAPVLMISGQDDRFWPSNTMAELLMQRLAAQDFAFAFQHHTFPHAGHRFYKHCDGPEINVRCDNDQAKILAHAYPQYPALAFANGGTVVGNAYAAHHSVTEVIAFLQRHLGRVEAYDDLPWFVVHG